MSTTRHHLFFLILQLMSHLTAFIILFWKNCNRNVVASVAIGLEPGLFILWHFRNFYVNGCTVLSVLSCDVGF